jgi:hypothetical protein
MITGAHCRGTSPWVRPNYGLSCSTVAACTLGELLTLSRLGGRAWPTGRSSQLGWLVTQPFFLGVSNG